MKQFLDTEDIQMYWISVEADLNEIIQSGTVPETDHYSGGKKLVLNEYNLSLCVCRWGMFSLLKGSLVLAKIVLPINNFAASCHH